MAKKIHPHDESVERRELRRCMVSLNTGQHLSDDMDRHQVEKAGYSPCPSTVLPQPEVIAATAAADGLSLHQIGQLLGHRNPRTTVRYSDWLDDPARQAADKALSQDEGHDQPSPQKGTSS